jgi:hypothetical protein
MADLIAAEGYRVLHALGFNGHIPTNPSGLFPSGTPRKPGSLSARLLRVAALKSGATTQLAKKAR